MLYNRPAYTVSLIILVCNLLGCAAPRTTIWSVETYLESCSSQLLPHEPLCLYPIDGKFRSMSQFNVCKESVNNYLTALDSHYKCSIDRLSDLFNSLLKSTQSVINCYSKFYTDKNTGDITSICPPVVIPNFISNAEGIDGNFGVPLCVARYDKYFTPPQHEFAFNTCKDDVEVFLGKSRTDHTIFSKSAQKQFDDYKKNLKEKIDQTADKVVNKFICLAEGKGLCL